MRHLGIFLLVVVTATAAFAQTNPPSPPVARGKAGAQPSGGIDFRPTRGLNTAKPQSTKYSVSQCSSAALGNGDLPTDDLATWCAWHAPRATIALLMFRFRTAWELGHPSAPPDARCAPIRKLLDKPFSEVDLKRYLAALDNFRAQFDALPGAEQEKLDQLAHACTITSPNLDDRLESIEIVDDFVSNKNYNLGWDEAWRHAWDGGWDAGAKAQLSDDKKVLDDVIGKDADRYSDLVKDYNALAEQFRKVVLPQPHGFWASLALALASRPASGTPGSLDSTCTEEVGAWPTTFNCGNVTCTREVGAWPATFDCH